MRKRDVAVVSALTLAGVAAVAEWPGRAALIEVIVYSLVAPGLLFMGLWSDRHRPRFWEGMFCVCLLHSVFIFLIRTYFPFKTILTVIPIAVVEDIFFAIFMVKVLGDEPD